MCPRRQLRPPTVIPDELDERWDDDLPDCCPECDGAGYVITCIDDLCVAAGECIHGDGEEVCPTCEGEGII